MDHGQQDFHAHSADTRPLKRFRSLKDGDDGLRPYVHASAPPGLPPDAEGSGEPATKKGGKKRPLSCGECRRLKLKCDRVFPCQSCQKRGCAQICPEGALTGGKGSRFILANTEQLHEKIKVMSDRIRELEGGLQTVHSRVSADEHPLLRHELLSIKKSPELFGIDQQAANPDVAPDSTSVVDDISAEFSAASSSKDGDEQKRSGASSAAASGNNNAFFPENLAQLSRAFPSPWSISFELDLKMRRQIHDLLPPREEAERLCLQARKNAFWQFHPDSSDSFLPNLLHSVYTTPLSTLMPHRLGMLLMVLAIGAAVDLESPNGKQTGEHYYHLARAALCEIPVMDDTSLDAVQALFLMEWYLLTYSDNKKALEHAFGIIGLAVKLSHTIALHRDSVRSKVIPEELDKRRRLFWNLVRTDARLSLALRRPPSINLQHVDMKRPVVEDNDEVVNEYVWWQNEFLVECTIPVVETTMSVQPVSYKDVLQLDRKIRNFDIPLSLQMVEIDDAPPTHPLGMQQALITCSRLCTIMHLHRSYFTVALTSNDNFTVQHAYAPSVLAIYEGACNLISTIYTVYKWEPELSTRYTIYWNNCFSAACALCFLVSRVPSLPIAPNALQELDKASQLFTEIRERSPKAAVYFPVLQKLITRAREHYVAWRNGSGAPRDEMTDEISILVRKVLPAAANTPATPTVAIADPFEHAHPFLRRCLEKATAEDPCTATGFHLTRIRGFGGGSVSHSAASVSASASKVTYSANGGMNSADIADSSWMTWL
ncbi:hypothetical protein BDW22DRAFT_1389654 [Trametopsis cervina]|nr:hypothetical protein BDW22DRAFT_1389654 [Trametopsis cervina]